MSECDHRKQLDNLRRDRDDAWDLYVRILEAMDEVREQMTDLKDRLLALNNPGM